MNEQELKKVNTTAFAYMGDAVWEQYVREHILQRGSYDVNKLHRLSTTFVKASAQAEIIKTIFDELNEEEQALVKRARNRKFTTKAKNADPITYKWATAFEALVGFLFMKKDEERLQWVMKKAVAVIEGGENE